MKNLILFITFFIISFASSAQTFSYSYDASGNRIHRQIVTLKCPEHLSDTAGTSPVVSQAGEMSIRIFPNPTAGALRIEITNLPDKALGGLMVWNLQGQELLQMNNITASTVVDLSAQPAGNYMMRMTVGQEVKEWKVVKQ